MRAEVLRRRAGGAAAYGSYRRSDAGRGAWGGYGLGSDWTPNPEDGFPEQGKGEVVYMSNERFMSIFIAIVSGSYSMERWWQDKCLMEAPGKSCLYRTTGSPMLESSH
jgi:hypothetical protein